MKTKTASVRLPKEMYEEIDNICDGVGCSRNDWIKDTLQDKLREENSQDQEENSSGPDRNTTPKEEPKPKEPQKVFIDFTPDEKPKEPQKITISDIPQATVSAMPQDNSNNPAIQMVYFGNKLLPFAKRYNI